MLWATNCIYNDSFYLNMRNHKYGIINWNFGNKLILSKSTELCHINSMLRSQNGLSKQKGGSFILIPAPYYSTIKMQQNNTYTLDLLQSLVVSNMLFVSPGIYRRDYAITHMVYYMCGVCVNVSMYVVQACEHNIYHSKRAMHEQDLVRRPD